MRNFPKNTFDFTSLIARISTGTLMFYLHGLGKITSGYDRWERLGKTITDVIGVDSMAIPLGLMASISESILAIFILVGFYTRTSTFFLGFTMMVAFNKHLFSEGLKSGEMALLYLILCIIIFLLGPGKYSIDRLIKR
ncbi:MAG: DoxX family protein [Flavobacteriaceae bacterium TMED206]|nr:MAG: DoxX family protein [Flavobacteriaceae bacterium TMED206]